MGAMFDIETEIEKLECSASECALISDLATDRRARNENGELASEYRQRAEDLKCMRGYPKDKKSRPKRGSGVLTGAL
jgi:hypothetical protein